MRAVSITPFFTGRNLTSDLWSEMDRMIDDFAKTDRPSYDEKYFSPATEILENAENYLLSIDVPGIKKENIQIEFVDNTLTISGERTNTRSAEDAKVRRLERSYGHFKRSFALPRTVNSQKIEAHYENGVLELLIPKAQEAQARKIEVQTGKSGFFSDLIGSKKEDAK
ncbi:Spore protein SP21 [compost metagenome]